MKTYLAYTDRQFEEFEAFVEEKFQNKCSTIAHETDSEFVHTDVFQIKSEPGDSLFVTCGMGAGKMSAPMGAKRCELVALASPSLDPTSDEGMIISRELVKISKFPFREETWLGTGHTINASKRFKEAFGYDYIAFISLPMTAKLSGMSEEVGILLAVPIYESEREWCVKNHTLALLEQLHEKYDGKEFYTDFKRDKLIPEKLDPDEIAKLTVMTVLEINRETLEKLEEYIAEQEEMGIEPDYDEISRWVKENR